MSMGNLSYDSLALGDGLRRFLDIVRLLRGMDLSRLADLFSLLQQIISSDDLRSQIRKGLELMKLVVEMTPTEKDDQVAEVISRLLTDQVIDAIAALIEGFFGKQADAALAAQSVATHRAQLEAQGIPWDVIMQLALYLNQLLELIRSWKVGNGG